MIGLTGKKLSAGLHRDLLKDNIHFPQVGPPTGRCQQIKCFLGEPGFCRSCCVYIPSALFTGNAKPTALGDKGWAWTALLQRHGNLRQWFLMDSGRSAAVARLTQWVTCSNDLSLTVGWDRKSPRPEGCKQQMSHLWAHSVSDSQIKWLPIFQSGLIPRERLWQWFYLIFFDWRTFKKPAH